MEISLEMRAVVPPRVLMREIEGESVFLNIDSEVYFELDAVGTGMCRALTTSKTIRDAYESLREEYDADPDRLRQDLLDLVARLEENGLVELRA